ncbi:MAG: hypothetical protein EP347_05050 [Alphaproteobacteria bacterium]|nr:MAG: hypothetical protein EP347_05050 [Alphaproteobacteria bacterium]
MEKEQRGQMAQALLGNDLLKETFAALEEIYITAWKAARTQDAREDAHRYVHLLGKFKEHLASVALTGELESRRQAELKGRRFNLR